MQSMSYSNVQETASNGSETTPSPSTTHWASLKIDGEKYLKTCLVGQSTIYLSDLINRTVQDGDCLLWTGPSNGSGYPMVSITRKNHTLRTILAVLYKKNKRSNQVVTTTCGNKRCIHPDHLRIVGKKSVFKISIANYKSPIRSAKLSAYARANRAKLNMDQAREIRMSDKTHRELALEYGVNKATIGNIKAGRTWKETGNLWRGL